MYKKRSVKILLGIAISSVALMLVIRNMQFSDFIESSRQVKSKYIVYTILVMVVNLFVRAKRWQVMLRPLTRIRWLNDSFTCYTIGYMANMLLPLRPGEILRPYLLGKKKGFSKSSVLATVILERIWDITYLAILFFICIELSNANIPLNMKKAVFLGGSATGLILAILCLMLLNPKIKSKAGRFFRFLPNKTEQFLKKFANLLLLGFQTLNNFWFSLYILFITVVVWICSFLMADFCMLAFGLDLPWYIPVFATIIANFGMMLPSLPGGIGVAHALYVFTLSVFSVDKSVAFGIALLVHGTGYIVVVCIGFISLWIEGLSFVQLRKISVENN
jgi:uncharacterized protein (TIRG00374 family)